MKPRLCYVTNRKMTNTSLREGFGISDQNAATASRLLNEALDAGSIVIGSDGRDAQPKLPAILGRFPVG